MPCHAILALMFHSGNIFDSRCLIDTVQIIVLACCKETVEEYPVRCENVGLKITQVTLKEITKSKEGREHCLVGTWENHLIPYKAS